MLDEQTGELQSGQEAAGGHRRNGDKFRTAYGDFAGTEREHGVLYGDRGGASRFFYTAKASAAERSAGLPEGDRSHHPTVKPIDLMRWLVRLVCPPGGTILDPFCGSGTTGIAAVLEGFDFIGIERDPEYHPIAEARIRWWAAQPAGISVERALAGEAERQKVAESGQTTLC
jgi:DNA modification methylase